MQPWIFCQCGRAADIETAGDTSTFACKDHGWIATNTEVK